MTAPQLEEVRAAALRCRELGLPAGAAARVLCRSFARGDVRDREVVAVVVGAYRIGGAA